MYRLENFTIWLHILIVPLRVSVVSGVRIYGPLHLDPAERAVAISGVLENARIDRWRCEMAEQPPFLGDEAAALGWR